MEIREFLQKAVQPGKRYSIMGIGSTLRMDDAAGMYLIELLRERIVRDDILLIAGSTAPENFTGVIKEFRPDTLFIIDAAHLGIAPGGVKIVPSGDIGGVSFSTHMLPLPVMLKYLESESGCDVVFIGIQPECTDQGLSMCGVVKRGTELLAEVFLELWGDNYHTPIQCTKKR